MIGHRISQARISSRPAGYGIGRTAAVKAPAAVRPRVLAIAVPVIVAGAFVFGLAVYEYASTPRSAGDLAALFVLFVVMALAERFPVPVEGMGASGVTLGFVFSVSTIILLGWPAGVIVAAGAPAVVHILQHRPPLRIAYNGSMFALSALAAGLAIEHVHGSSTRSSSRGSSCADSSTTGLSTSC